MSEHEGRRLYTHLRDSGATEILEIGTFHGVGAAYMAAAVEENGGGSVTTVDTAFWIPDPAPEEVLERAGLGELVDVVQVRDSSYTWWLKQQIESQSDEAGNCTPIYDFAYLDGAHTWTIDGFAALLIERLLRPDGWLLMDDLGFVFEGYGGPYGPGMSPEDHRFSTDEAQAQQLQLVFDLIVKPHPSFTEFRIDDGAWGWAHKAPGNPRRLELETSTSIGSLVIDRVRGLRSRLAR